MEAASTGFAVGPGVGPAWQMEVGRPAIFKLLSEETGGNIAVFEETVPPGMGTPLHIHSTSDEVLYVFSGEFTFQLGTVKKQVAGGSWVFVPLGSVHGWRNSGESDARIFFFFTPGAGAKALEDMRHQGIPLPDIPDHRREEIFRRYGYEFITWDW